MHCPSKDPLPGKPINIRARNMLYGRIKAMLRNYYLNNHFSTRVLTVNIFHHLGNLLSFQISLFMLKAQICSWFSCCIPVDQNWARLLALSVSLLSRQGKWNTFLVRKEHVDAVRAPVSSVCAGPWWSWYQIHRSLLESSKLEVLTTNPPLVSQQPAHRYQNHSHSTAECPRSLSIHSKKEKFNIKHGFLRGQKEEIKSCKPPTSPYSATEVFKFGHQT